MDPLCRRRPWRRTSTSPSWEPLTRFQVQIQHRYKVLHTNYVQIYINRSRVDPPNGCCVARSQVLKTHNAQPPFSWKCPPAIACGSRHGLSLHFRRRDKFGVALYDPRVPYSHLASLREIQEGDAEEMDRQATRSFSTGTLARLTQALHSPKPLDHQPRESAVIPPLSRKQPPKRSFRSLSPSN